MKNEKLDKTFRMDRIETIQTVRLYIQDCQGKNHIQQVTFSTFHDCLTQVCFNCKKVRTSIKGKEIEKLTGGNDEQ